MLHKRKSEDRLWERFQRSPCFGSSVDFYAQEYGCGEESPRLFLFERGCPMEQKEQTLNPSEQTILEVLRSMDYGEITITVHNGKPTIMEVSKKIKF